MSFLIESYADSITACFINVQPKSKWSGIILSTIPYIYPSFSMYFCSKFFIFLLMLALRGYLDVTCANGPAILFIIFIQLYWNLLGSGYNAKSFNMSCLVVTFAILTVLSITGSTISWIDRSIVWLMISLKLMLSSLYFSYIYWCLKGVFLIIG